MMRRMILKAVLAGVSMIAGLALMPGVSRADSYTFNIVASTVTVTTVSQAGVPSNIVASDVHGIGVVNVFDITPSFLGPVELGNLTASFGNAVVFDSDFPGLTQAVGDTLGFAAANFGGATTDILGIGTVVVGPITDPALLPFLGTLDFGFTLNSSTVDGNNQTISTWNLTSITQVPEPSSVVLLLVALAGLAAWRSKAAAALQAQS